MTSPNTTPADADPPPPQVSEPPRGPDCQGEANFFLYGSAFEAAGSALWADLAAETDPFSLTVLVIEACRLADRLSRFDELLRGEVDTWMRLTHRLLTDDYELKIDSAAAEARQTAAALRQLLVEIRRQKSEQDDPGDDDPLDDL